MREVRFPSVMEGAQDRGESRDRNPPTARLERKSNRRCLTVGAWQLVAWINGSLVQGLRSRSSITGWYRCFPTNTHTISPPNMWRTCCEDYSQPHDSAMPVSHVMSGFQVSQPACAYTYLHACTASLSMSCTCDRPGRDYGKRQCQMTFNNSTIKVSVNITQRRAAWRAL